MTIRKSLAVLALVGVATAGCVDLEVLNPNDADRDRALNTPGDIEALVAGGYSNWWNSASNNSGPVPILATVANAHSATAANYGMVEFSSWPRVPAQNRAADVYSGNNTQYAWTQLWRAVASVTEGLRILESGAVELPAAEFQRVKAYGYFVLGMAHGSAALLYDQGYVYDPSMSVEDVELQPYGQVLEAALGYFDRSIQEATGASFTLPQTWMSVEDMTADRLRRLAISMKARYRANVARTPEERAAVNWNAVIADVDNGIQNDFLMNVATGSGFSSTSYVNMFRFGPWGQMSYQVLGMADQSGGYQTWIAKDPWDRHPNLSADQTSQPFLIQTPDNRFPTGTTITEQQANPGTKFEVTTRGGGWGAQWARPDRGTFRWSYYRTWIHDNWQSANSSQRTTHPELTRAELQLLKAEGLYRNGDRAGAAAIVNVYRAEAGLSATDANGTNTSCVPRLPNGSCGDLFEMLKWEKRLETQYHGLHGGTWYFDGRGWGDLAQGTFLQLPIPERELELLGLPVYTFGGIGGDFSAPAGTYGY